jgi:hypothetical protein
MYGERCRARHSLERSTRVIALEGCVEGVEPILFVSLSRLRYSGSAGEPGRWAEDAGSPQRGGLPEGLYDPGHTDSDRVGEDEGRPALGSRGAIRGRA